MNVSSRAAVRMTFVVLCEMSVLLNGLLLFWYNLVQIFMPPLVGKL